jgi:hypothetical protein
MQPVWSMDLHLRTGRLGRLPVMAAPGSSEPQRPVLKALQTFHERRAPSRVAGSANGCCSCHRTNVRGPLQPVERAVPPPAMRHKGASRSVTGNSWYATARESQSAKQRMSSALGVSPFGSTTFDAYGIEQDERKSSRYFSTTLRRSM